MLNDADFSQFKHVYIFVGKTDLRKGIDGLATLVKQKFSLDPFQPGNLFLFCGSSNRKIKGLVWEELSAAFCYPHISSFYTKICSFLWKKYADKNYLRPQMRASSSSSSGHS